MTKGQAHRVRKQIYDHQMRNSHIYVELADAPPSVQQMFLGSFSNPLTRRYVAGRLVDATLDLALSRVGDLDPMPFEHVHEGCPLNEGRTQEAHESEHDQFKPRFGFISDPAAYGV